MALLLHECFDTLHQLIGRIHGIWFSEFVGGRLTDSVEHKANPANGSSVSNKATIVFDYNKPLRDRHR